MIGQTLSHYKIVEKLGEGGMGAVYLAEDGRLGRQVALKILPAEMADDPERLERFEREAKVVAALNHPNIVTIHSVEEADGVRFLTMERVEGVSLEEKVVPGGLGLDDFLGIAKPLVEAVCAAHERGITHRDLKPANVMVGDDGRVKVLDFGLAKLQEDRRAAEVTELSTQGLTRDGVVLGTVPYMSPEQVQGRAADHRSDIFSIGIIFYQLLTGQRPFRGETSADVISSILRDQPGSVTSLNAHLPNHIGRIVRRCLEKDPNGRYQTARDLLNELEELRREAAASEQPAGSSIAVLPFTNMSSDPEQEYFCEGIAEELINGLGRIKNLRVASRTAAFQFKGRGFDIREVGEKLNVGTLLEGSVRKAGNRLRITAQLVNVADGYRLWSERYDRTMEDIFAIQDEIAESIVKALEMTLSPKERRAIQNVATRDVGAYDYYLRGRKFFYGFDRKNFDFARRMYTKAIELDPNYALAYAGIADCCSFLCMYALGKAEDREKADEASRKALELDPDLAEAHASRGLALSLNKKYDEAEVEFEKAIELNSKLYEAYYFYARVCVAQGKFEKAAELYEKAIEVRPEDYQAPLLLPQVLVRLERDEEEISEAHRRAVAVTQRHLDLNPGDVRALVLGASSLMALEQRDKALAWLDQALSLAPEEPHLLYNVACVYASAGEEERALETLERSVRLGYAHKSWIENDSDLDSIRDHLRFRQIVSMIDERE
ncbi:MAG: protein kinase [Thermoanaerobaculia bacterium]|nr:protein kinase [Thermoanaerobaculia bacterium]